MSLLRHCLRCFLLGIMHGAGALEWLVSVSLGPLDRAVQNAVNTVVWELEWHGVERARIHYVIDISTAFTLLTMAALERVIVSAVVGGAMVLVAHSARAAQSCPPATPSVQFGKLTLALGGALTVYGHHLTHAAPSRTALSASYFVLLLLGIYVRRVPRTPPPRRRKAPVLQPASE
jgi:hypothetical protein